MGGPVIILDTSCLDRLREDSARSGFERQLSFTSATPVATSINLIEVLRHKSVPKRERLIETLRYLAGDRPLFPWPYGLLEQVGHAIVADDDGFELPPSGLEKFLFNGPAEKDLTAANEMVESMETQFRDMNFNARSPVRRFVRDRGLSKEWSDARIFLDQMWMQPSHIDDYILGMWGRLNLPEPPPVDKVRANPTWRVFFEAYGVAAYEQAFSTNQPRTFGMLDLLQLTYTTGFRGGSIFVTDDIPLARVGEIVVTQRVPRARVLMWSDFAEF